LTETNRTNLILIVPCTFLFTDTTYQGILAWQEVMHSLAKLVKRIQI